MLDGRRAATNWSFCASFAQRFPMVRVEPDPIFVRDGDIWTSAGVTAGIDLALAQEDLGSTGHLDQDLSLPVLAAQARMSERTLTRRFVEASGFTPARAVERLRLEAARRLLSETRTPAKRIAQRCGFGSEETMRRSFLRLLAVTPHDYRARFGR